jgi:hypothetical protein
MLHERLRRPLHGAPADERAHRQHRGGRGAQRLADAWDGEDRADRDDRVRWPDHDRLGLRDRVEDLRRGPRGVRAAELDVLDRRRCAFDDHEALELHPLAVRPDVRPDRVVAGGQDACVDPARAHDRRVRLGEPDALAQQLGPHEAERKVPVA